MQKALDNISNKNVTTVIIAHRLSTIKNADVIYAIKNGKVLENGTHEELLKLNGYYAGMVKAQLDGNDKNDKVTRKHTSIYSNTSEIFIDEEEKEEENAPKDKKKKKKNCWVFEGVEFFLFLEIVKCLFFSHL